MNTEISIPDTAGNGWKVEVFYDGDCPLCLREIKLLRKWDRDDKIRFTDIADPDFDAASLGRIYEDLITEIHGRLPDGSWIRGVEVFRHLYSAVGYSRLVSLTRLPGLSHTLDWGYRLFARNRLRLTGRCSTNSDICKIESTKPHH